MSATGTAVNCGAAHRCENVAQRGESSGSGFAHLDPAGFRSTAGCRGVVAERVALAGCGIGRAEGVAGVRARGAGLAGLVAGAAVGAAALELVPVADDRQVAAPCANSSSADEDTEGRLHYNDTERNMECCA